MPAFQSSLEAIARDMLGPLLQLEVTSRSGWRLIGWDADYGLSFTLGRGDRVLLIEAEARDEARECYARTSRFNLHVRPLFQPGGTLTPEERRVADQVARILRDRERRLPIVERVPLRARRSAKSRSVVC